jgi:hypothetical protein
MQLNIVLLSLEYDYSTMFHFLFSGLISVHQTKRESIAFAAPCFCEIDLRIKPVLMATQTDTAAEELQLIRSTTRRS